MFWKHLMHNKYIYDNQVEASYEYTVETMSNIIS